MMSNPLLQKSNINFNRRRAVALAHAVEALERRTLLAVTGLVAAYSLDDGFNTTVADYSGNGNNGTTTNTV